VPRNLGSLQVLDGVVHNQLPIEKLSCPTFNPKFKLKCRLGCEKQLLRDAA